MGKYYILLGQIRCVYLCVLVCMGVFMHTYMCAATSFVCTPADFGTHEAKASTSIEASTLLLCLSTLNRISLKISLWNYMDKCKQMLCLNSEYFGFEMSVVVSRPVMRMTKTYLSLCWDWALPYSSQIPCNWWSEQSRMHVDISHPGSCFMMR